MESIRCNNCTKLLFKTNLTATKGRIEIKCTRCGTFNDVRSAEIQSKAYYHATNNTR
ncbi:Com family DNA-binding transcriptional regulator [Polycladidibacter stylochi]|uniref:Com family DNA-binding transcriptional regulator n=1 Tax=Polycladidibacter stylochi TaxID=1807766 RepID=UPI0012E33F77